MRIPLSFISSSSSPLYPPSNSRACQSKSPSSALVSLYDPRSFLLPVPTALSLLAKYDTLKLTHDAGRQKQSSYLQRDQSHQEEEVRCPVLQAVKPGGSGVCSEGHGGHSPEFRGNGLCRAYFPPRPASSPHMGPFPYNNYLYTRPVQEAYSGYTQRAYPQSGGYYSRQTSSIRGGGSVASS